MYNQHISIAVIMIAVIIIISYINVYIIIVNKNRFKSKVVQCKYTLLPLTLWVTL